MRKEEEEKRKEDEIFDRLCSPGGIEKKEMDGVSSLMRYHRERRETTGMKLVMNLK